MPEMTEERKAFIARIRPAWDNLGPFRSLIYGPKGAGKTVFAAGADDCIVFDTEDSRRSLLNHPETRNVRTFSVKRWNDMDEIAWAIRDGDITCRTIVVDTLDKLANDTVTELLDKAVAADNKRNPFAASQAEYRVRNELFKRLTADWAGLGVNLIFTAHASEVKDESTGSFVIKPALSDGMSDMMGGFVVVQGYLTVTESDGEKNDQRQLQVHPSRRVDAKTRIGGLPRIIESPSIQSLIDAHYDGVKQAVDQKEQTS